MLKKEVIETAEGEVRWVKSGNDMVLQQKWGVQCCHYGPEEGDIEYKPPTFEWRDVPIEDWN